MASDSQIQANRQNAQLSTGPRSPEGKQRVAFNALKHGLTGKQVVLHNEEPEDFDAFRSALWDDLDPRGVLEGVLVDKIVADAWRLRRVPILEAAMHARVEDDGYLERLRSKIFYIHRIADANSRRYEQEKLRVDSRDQDMFAQVEGAVKELESRADDPSFVVTRALEKHARDFDNLSRREEALTKSMLRGLHELERLQRRRAGEQVAAPAAVDVDIHVNHNGGEES
jgi:hypothetical protein